MRTLYAPLIRHNDDCVKGAVRGNFSLGICCVAFGIGICSCISVRETEHVTFNFSLLSKMHIKKMKGWKSRLSGPRIKCLIIVSLFIAMLALLVLACCFIWSRDRRMKIPDIVLHDPDTCKEYDYLDWIVIATSAAENSHRRMLLRETYGNNDTYENRRFKLFFFVGKSGEASVNDDVVKEFQQYRDVVVGDFVDSFRNSSLKLMLGLNWISEYCNKSPYFIKVNDDTLVNMFEVGKVLDKTSITKNFIMCSVIEDKQIMRFKNDMEYCRESGICVEEEDLVGFTKYPKHCHGAMYVFSNDLLQRLLNAMSETVFFWQGDVYVTGLVPQRLGIRYVDISRHYADEEQMYIQLYNEDQNVEIISYFSQVEDPFLFKEIWILLMNRIHK